MVYFHFIHALIRITLINFALFYLFTPNVTYLKNVALTFSFRQLSERGKKKKKKFIGKKSKSSPTNGMTSVISRKLSLCNP